MPEAHGRNDHHCAGHKALEIDSLAVHGGEVVEGLVDFANVAADESLGPAGVGLEV